jgi:hypothetical protein
MTGILLSLNEIAALALKASRGAGLDWGLAEEAAAATVSLSDCGLDGPALLADWLHRRGRDGAGQCPLEIGSGFCDLPPDAPVALGWVGTPSLLIPFIAQLATRSGLCPGLARPGDGWLSAEDLLRCDMADLVLHPDGAPAIPLRNGPRLKTSAGTLVRLESLALRTTVPVSASSRADAGAGLLDND